MGPSSGMTAAMSPPILRGLGERGVSPSSVMAGLLLSTSPFGAETPRWGALYGAR